MLSDSLRAADGDRLIVCEQDLSIDTKSFYELQAIVVILYPLMIITCGTLFVMFKISIIHDKFKCTWIYLSIIGLVLFLLIIFGSPVLISIHAAFFLVSFLNSVSFINFMWGETTECNFGLLRYQLLLAFVLSFDTVSICVVMYNIYIYFKTFINICCVVRQSDSLNEDHDSVSEVGYKTNQCNH